MTVSSAVRKAGPFAGNNAATMFPFSFKVFAKGDIKVLRANPSGAATQLTLDSDYSVQLNANQDQQPGGWVTYPRQGGDGMPLPSGYDLVLLGSLPYDQETDLTNTGGFYPQTVEDMSDRSTIQIQQLAEVTSRAIVIPEVESTSPVLPAAQARANSVVGFDATGNLTTLPLPASVGAGDLKNEEWTDGTDFTAGTSNSVTLSRAYGTKANLGAVVMQGVGQAPSSYSLNGLTLTFDAIIPLGVKKIWCTGGTTLSTEIPPAGSVATDALIDESVTGAKLAPGAAAENLSDSAITQESTGHFWTSDGARIHRFNDRLFTGTATLNDGKSTQLAGDWTFSQYAVAGVGAFAYLEHWATMAVGSPNGQPTFVAASRSSDGGGPGNGAIGISSVVVNDNASGAGSDTWNYYGTTVRDSAATGQSTIGMELDVTNMGSGVPIFPGRMFQHGLTANLWIAAGGELPSQVGNTYAFNDVSCAMGIFSNAPSGIENCQFEKGIVFGVGGVSSEVAVALPENYSISWFNDSTSGLTSSVFSSATLTDVPHIQKLQFSDFGTLFTDGQASTQFRVLNGVSNAVNYLGVQAASASQVPALMALGTDTNVDLKLVPHGAGKIWLGAFTAGTPSATGYIEVKAADGTVVQLLGRAV
jgi:hypothetical protein